MTDNELIDDLRIALTASRGQTGARLRARLVDLVRVTAARTCLDEAIERAARCGSNELFFQLVDVLQAVDASQDDWRSRLEAVLPAISWLNAEGNET